MSSSNGIRSPKVLWGSAIGVAVVAFGAYFFMQKQPDDVTVQDSAAVATSAATNEDSASTTAEDTTGSMSEEAATPNGADAAAATSEDGTAAPESEQVYAIIDGVPVTEVDLAIFAQDYAQEFERIPPEMRVTELVNGITEMRLLSKAAVEEGIDKDDLTKKRLAFDRARVLSSEYLRKTVIDVISTETVRARFDEEIAEFKPDDELHLYHILVETEAESLEIIADIEGGGDFAAIAAEKSKDPGSGANGGDLGFVPRGMTVPEFENAAFALETGQFTKEPVESQFGWHVIKLEEKRKTQPPEFDAEEPRIRSELVRESIDNTIESLRAAADIEIIPAPEVSTDASEEPTGDVENTLSEGGEGGSAQ